MKLGVVILTHDRRDDLIRAIQSVVGTDLDARIYVVFDADQPDIPFYQHVVFVRGEPGILGESRRRGADAARQDGCAAIVELDDDDFMLSGGIAAIRIALANADVVYADFEYAVGDGLARTWKMPYEPGCFAGGCWSAGVRAYRLSAYDAVGCHNRFLGLCEDYDLFIRFDLSPNVRVAGVAEPVARVAHRGDGLSTIMYPELARIGRALVTLYYGTKGKAGDA